MDTALAVTVSIYTTISSVCPARLLSTTIPSVMHLYYSLIGEANGVARVRGLQELSANVQEVH
jgi:hypothetical protein